ncbi:MAG: DUF1475 family protein [Acidobacteriota bacterium]
MRNALVLLFGAILAIMIGVTWWAGMQVSIWDCWPQFAGDRWTIATLFDAYCGFITFYVWLAWRERAWGARILWFLLVMGLGNMAMSAYVLIELARLRKGQGADALFTKKIA